MPNPFNKLLHGRRSTSKTPRDTGKIPTSASAQSAPLRAQPASHSHPQQPSVVSAQPGSSTAADSGDQGSLPHRENVFTRFTPANTLRRLHRYMYSLALAYSTRFNYRGLESHTHGIWNYLLEDLVSDLSDQTLTIPQFTVTASPDIDEEPADTSMATTIPNERKSVIPDITGVFLGLKRRKRPLKAFRRRDLYSLSSTEPTPPAHTKRDFLELNAFCQTPRGYYSSDIMENSSKDPLSFEMLNWHNLKLTAFVTLFHAELKRFAGRRVIKATDFFYQVDSGLVNALQSAEEQARVIFQSEPETQILISILAVGEWWSFQITTRPSESEDVPLFVGEDYKFLDEPHSAGKRPRSLPQHPSVPVFSQPSPTSATKRDRNPEAMWGAPERFRTRVDPALINIDATMKGFESRFQSGKGKEDSKHGDEEDKYAGDADGDEHEEEDNDDDEYEGDNDDDGDDEYEGDDDDDDDDDDDEHGGGDEDENSEYEQDEYKEEDTEENDGENEDSEEAAASEEHGVGVGRASLDAPSGPPSDMEEGDRSFINDFSPPQPVENPKPNKGRPPISGDVPRRYLQHCTPGSEAHVVLKLRDAIPPRNTPSQAMLLGTPASNQRLYLIQELLRREISVLEAKYPPLKFPKDAPCY